MAKTRSKSEEKRSQILNAATHLFVQQGFSTTSMDQIATQAGVSKQTVYSHFGSKDDLFTASIASKCVAYRMTPDMFAGEDVRDVLLQTGRMFSQLVLSEEALCVHRICVSESETYPKLAELFFDAGPKPVIAIFTDYLTSLNEQAVLSIKNPRFAAIQLLKMLHGEARMLAELGLHDRMDLAEHDRYLEDCVDMFLRAYRP